MYLYGDIISEVVLSHDCFWSLLYNGFAVDDLCFLHALSLRCHPLVSLGGRGGEGGGAFTTTSNTSWQSLINEAVSVLKDVGVF